MREWIKQAFLFVTPIFLAAVLLHVGIRRLYLGRSYIAPPPENTVTLMDKVKNALTGARNLASGKIDQVLGDKTAETCVSAEIRGEGPKSSYVSQEDWGLVRAQFNRSKALLRAWLHRNKKGFHPKTVAAMEEQLRKMTLTRPNLKDEPDLAWRGLAFYSRGEDEKKGSEVKVTSGFSKLTAKEPLRGLFEMTRIVAQAWAPCELRRTSSKVAWDPLLKCLKIDDEGCGKAGFSEAGWAVSTTLAANIAPPGCKIPALSNECLKIPLPEGKK
jgi:hypothetical protein